jgi:hypothetical protein
MAPGIVFTIISLILFSIAYLLYYKEAYWLISGINFSSKESAYERYDIPGLTKHLGRMCALIGLVILVSGIGAFLGRELLFTVPIGFIFLIIPVYLFGTERYLFDGKRLQRIINIAITMLMTIVAVFVIITTVSGSKPPVIEIKGDTLAIRSMYGAEIPLDTIRQVDLIDLSGKEISKLSGFNMGDVLKGRFTVEGLGSVTIYQQGTPCSSVLIRTAEDAYLINLGNGRTIRNCKGRS